MSLPDTAADIKEEIERLNRLRDEHGAARLDLLRRVNDLARSIVATDMSSDTIQRNSFTSLLSLRPLDIFYCK